jgi:hypothetical protein
VNHTRRIVTARAPRLEIADQMVMSIKTKSGNAILIRNRRAACGGPESNPALERQHDAAP